ncbi:MAG: solute carrier family 23 protein [Thiohalocapsa sp.]
MPIRPKDLIYALDERPPLGHLTLLGLQHVAALLPYLVLVAIVVTKSGDSSGVAHNAIALAMIAIAVTTILQSLRRGPIGSGFLAPPVVSAIYLPPCLLAAERGGLPLVCGMIVFAGVFEALLSWVLPRLRKIFPPVVSGMIVMAVGFELGLIGVKEFLDQSVAHAPDSQSMHYLTATVTLAVMVGLSVWAKGLLRLLCALLGIVLGYAFAVSVGLLTPDKQQAIAAAPLVGLPNAGFLAYHFDVELVLPFIIAGLASGLRVIGVVTTCQRINDAGWTRPEMSSIRGGILADGIGCGLSGLLGTPGISAAPSLVGLSKASGATSRSIAWAIGVWLLLLACLPKLATLILTMPNAVIGAALVFNGSFMLVAGIQILTSRPINARTTLVIGIPTLFGLSRQVLPDFYASLPHWMQPITGSIIDITLIGAVLANLLFLIGRKRTEVITLSGPTDIDLEGSRPVQAIEQQGAAWDVPRDVLTRAKTTVSDLLDLIAAGSSAEGPIDLRLSYDDFELTVLMTYQGVLPSLTSDQKPTREMLEEQSFAVGLTGFLSALQADRIDRQAHGSACSLKRVFNV